MEVSFQADKIIKFTIYSTVGFFYFRWRCWWGVAQVVGNQTNYQQSQFDVHLIQCQTSTDISGIVNIFAQYVQAYFQYVYTFKPYFVIKT